MKKLLLTLAALAATICTINAQTRMTLMEEFSGENCAGCWGQNPPFWKLCDSPLNTPRLIHITYMRPVPSTGMLYERTKVHSDARAMYYSPPFTPYGRYDGRVASPASANPGEVQYFSQAEIDAEAARPDSFNMVTSSAWNATYDSVITTVTITCVTAWSGVLPKMQLALTQTNDFKYPISKMPVTHFENIVQDMFPSASGTVLPTTWTAGMVQTYVIKGKVPTFLDKSVPIVMVAWMQQQNKDVVQASRANPLPPLPKDAAILHSHPPTPLICTTSPYTAVHTVWLRNTGNDPMTTADIFWKLDGGAYTSYAWTGSLAPGDSVSVTMPPISVPFTAALLHFIKDSVGRPNGAEDLNVLNNVKYDSFFIEPTVGRLLPYSTSFDESDSMFYATDNYHDMYQLNRVPIWNVYSGVGVGHSGNRAAGYFCTNAIYLHNDNMIVLPTLRLFAPTKSTLTFWESYTRTLPGYMDSLSVVYSTDCGASWNTIWKLGGTTMITAASTASAPTSPADYAQRTVSLAAIPVGDVLIGFNAKRSNGNFIFIDDVNITSTVVAVDEVSQSLKDIELYPNPASESAVLSFSLQQPSHVRIVISDITGREIQTLADNTLNDGSHTININTTTLVAGVYHVTISGDSGTQTKRLVVIK